MFYTPSKKPKIVVEAVKEEVKVAPSTVVKKDPVVLLADEASSLGYTLKDVNPKSDELQKRFRIFKNIGYNKYEGVFSTSGKITGAFIAS